MAWVSRYLEEKIKNNKLLKMVLSVKQQRIREQLAQCTVISCEADREGDRLCVMTGWSGVRTFGVNGLSLRLGKALGTVMGGGGLLGCEHSFGGRRCQRQIYRDNQCLLSLSNKDYCSAQYLNFLIISSDVRCNL